MSIHDEEMKSLQKKYQKLEEGLWDDVKKVGRSLFRNGIKVDISELIGEPPATWKELEQLETRIEYALRDRFPGKNIDVAIFGDESVAVLPSDMEGMEQEVFDTVAQITTH